MKPLPLVSKKLMKLLDVLVHISGYNTNLHIFYEIKLDLIVEMLNKLLTFFKFTKHN